MRAGIVHAFTAMVISLSLVGAPKPAKLQTGTLHNARGAAFAINSRYISLNGRPWMPTCGEFHYGRYPRREWYPELLKMKAGGINIVSTYVFWIYQEQQKGKWNWTGRRSLRSFLQDCKKAGLLAIVRMGPWAHGEVRNGGIPDWVMHSGCRIRSTDPRFLNLVRPLYRQIAGQMKGLLWKDGGPVIGVQMDNETANLPYLYALKKMALHDGIDVPFYTMTGWSRFRRLNGRLLPMFGGYPVGFWTNTTRAGRNMYRYAPAPTYSPHSVFHGLPYTTCETGGGMASSYAHRTLVNGPDIAAYALMEIANGSNWQGFYMYHGGWNPRGVRPYYLNEIHTGRWTNEMPDINYDFQAPLSACGLPRPQYGLLREQALFMHDFGAILAPMPATAPQRLPRSGHTGKTLRWDVRSNGRSGFIFFNNYSYHNPLPAKPHVQFQLHTTVGTLTVPAKPVTIGKGVFGWWPFNLNLDGVPLRYATAQPICHLPVHGERLYIFSATKGVTPEFVFPENFTAKFTGGAPTRLHDGSLEISVLKPGIRTAFTVRYQPKTGPWKDVGFVIISPRQAMELAKLKFAGQTRCIVTPAVLLPQNNSLQLQTTSARAVPLAILPGVPELLFNGRSVARQSAGSTTRYVAPAAHTQPVPVQFQLIHPANVAAARRLLPLQPHQWTQNNWRSAAAWTVLIPAADRNLPLILRLHYQGNVIHVRAGGKLLVDDFYHGKPLDVPLWRVKPAARAQLEVQIMPLFRHFHLILPPGVKPDFSTGKPLAALNAVNVQLLRTVHISVRRPIK